MTNWHPIAIEPQEPLKVTLATKQFGKWTLGFAWTRVSLGGSPTTPGLALYAQKAENPADRYICFSIKECMCFWERNKVPPRKAAQLLHVAFAHGNWEGVNAVDLD